MTQETKDKMAAIIAQQQGSKPAAPIQSKQPVNKPVFVQQPAQTATPSKLKSFSIIWHEGSGKHDGKTVTTWKEANSIMTAIYSEHSGQGYLKTKIRVEWENGKVIEDRADCSDSGGDFSPKRGTIGQYLSKQNSVMYSSNFNQGERVLCSFEDEAEEIKPIADIEQDIRNAKIEALADELSEVKMIMEDLIKRIQELKQ